MVELIPICKIPVLTQGRLRQPSLTALGQVDWLFELPHGRMRAMLKGFTTALALTMPATGLLAAKPNIVLVMADDLRCNVATDTLPL